MAAEIPRIDRNPFKLTLLAPSAVNTRGEMMPYHSWAANSVDLGGGTNLKNDLQVDGSPIGLGHKNSYPPNTDAVQEVVVSQNSVDAESGHSAGGLISMTLKSGEQRLARNRLLPGPLSVDERPGGPHPVHQQRHPPAHVRRHPRQRDHQEQAVQLLLAGTLESRLSGQLRHHRAHCAGARRGLLAVATTSTAGCKTIYDPYTTTLNAATGAVTRTPFAGKQGSARPFRSAFGVAAAGVSGTPTALVTTSPM